MTPAAVVIRVFRDDDWAAVVDLWNDTLRDTAPHNDPSLSIRKKCEVDPDLLLVAVDGATIVGTIMGGYDGHRGWMYSLAVSPSHRRRRIGSALVRAAESRLRHRGCLKINLQIRAGNDAVADFYRHLGYEVEDRIQMGRRLYDGDLS